MFWFKCCFCWFENRWVFFPCQCYSVSLKLGSFFHLLHGGFTLEGLLVCSLSVCLTARLSPLNKHSVWGWLIRSTSKYLNVLNLVYTCNFKAQVVNIVIDVIWPKTDLFHQSSAVIFNTAWTHDSFSELFCVKKKANSQWASWNHPTQSFFFTTCVADNHLRAWQTDW